MHPKGLRITFGANLIKKNSYFLFIQLITDKSETFAVRRP